MHQSIQCAITTTHNCKFIKITDLYFFYTMSA